MLRGAEWDKPLPLHALVGPVMQGLVRKLVHTRLRILVHFYVVAGTVCKNSGRDMALNVEVVLYLLHDARIQTSWIFCKMSQRKILSPN